jgi:hypothetical protein
MLAGVGGGGEKMGRGGGEERSGVVAWVREGSELRPWGLCSGVGEGWG